MPPRVWARRRRLRYARRRRSAARSGRQGALPALPHELVEIALEAFARARGLGIGREVRVVDRVHVGDAERPGTVLGARDAAHVCAADDAGREQLVLEHVARAEFLDRYIGVARGVRDGGELAPAADPDVARLVR